MGRKLLTYAAVLIGLEIVVFKASSAGTLFTQAGGATATVVKTIEGR